MDWTFLPWIKFNGLQWINDEKMWSRSRSRSRRSRHILPGAGAGAGALRTFYLEPEPESEPKCLPGAGAGAGAVKKFHGSASLHGTDDPVRSTMVNCCDVIAYFYVNGALCRGKRHCSIMVIFKRLVAHLNHHWFTKYFTCSFTKPFQLLRAAK